MKVLILDNYDSFVYNLAQYAGEIADEVVVKRNDELNIAAVRRLDPDKIIISPGPGTPADPRYLGICTEVLRKVSIETPTLGVCLGHQGIVHSFGGKIVRAKRLRHGKTSSIRHDGKGIFRGLENPFEATRYHSLVADPRTLPDSLEVSARSEDDQEVMAVRHREFPIEGVQFHPESILTVQGHRMIANFLEA
ncbi:aminodeoxychorismate/anthranilate synthase component II [Candidatus Bathyarchaeota archaeon]|nr:MAG: aminodeoxychorismate/anthranilate synthase component II [Candidatus Bathyarchaeota archaeon]